MSCILNLPSQNEVILSLSFIVFSFHVQLDTVLAMYTNIYCQRIALSVKGQRRVLGPKILSSVGYGAFFLGVKRSWRSGLCLVLHLKLHEVLIVVLN